MKVELVKMLCCPVCGDGVMLYPGEQVGGEVESGELICQGCAKSYPIRGSIPRFVPADNYARSFAIQWNSFQKTQLDSHIGQPISRQRFLRESGWHPEDMKGKRILDVGCGAGRFTEVSLSFGAKVVAVDFSGAVDACWSNFAQHPNLHVIQADVLALPLRTGLFDYVYCFGVLQHTPDVRRSLLSLPAMLRPGGRLAVDLYPKSALTWLWTKYWLRPLTKRMDPMRLFRIVELVTPSLLGASDLIGRLPLFGRKLRYLVPVVNYRGMYELSEAQHVEFATLDTFDMLAPAHDHPQTAATLSRWLDETALADVEVFLDGQLIGRATKS